MNYNEDQISQAMELHPSLWVKKYSVKNESGLPIEFKNHNFLKDIYDDLSPFQVVLKPPQIGMTVLQIIKTMYCAKKKGWDIIYTLPTQSDVNDMAGGKINRIVAQNPILRSWVKDHDTVEQKSIGKNIIYYRGTFSTKQAMMVSSDLNVHDEVDASDPQVITQYETRLQAKADGKRWYFSHPSLAGFGVDIYWQQSDKKEWFIECSTCNQEQVMTFPESIDKEKKSFICKHCASEITVQDRINGKWKATAEGLFSGYHISQLMCPWVTADKILTDWNDVQRGHKDMQYFWNMVLGLPYVGSDAKVNAEDVNKNILPAINKQEGRIIIGVDTGLPIHFGIMNKQGMFYHATCKPPSADHDPYTELENLLIRYPKSVMVADQGGDLIGIRRLQAKYPGRVFLCFYRKDRKSKELIRWGEKQEYGQVVVDRNRMIQLTIDQMRDGGRITFNGSKEDWKPMVEHFGNIYRVTEETPYGNEYQWERTGPDHYVHVLVYCLVGLSKFRDEVEIIQADNDFLDSLEEGRIFNTHEDY